MSKPAPAWAVPIQGKEQQYHGHVCPTHGTTERFLCNRACVACTRMRAAARPSYGLTQDQVDLLLLSQGGVCAICKTDQPDDKNGWHVDHDHSTGAARGVLCRPCNLGLGFFKDSIESLGRAAEYLNGDEQAARLFFVREAAFALPPTETSIARARTADVTGNRGSSRLNSKELS
jgi:hypothetical protein